MAASSATQAALLEARRAFEHDEFERALQLAAPLAARDEPAALAVVVNAAIRLRRPDPAIVALLRLRALGSADASSDRRLAALYNLRGGQRRGHDENAALGDFERALALQPGQREAGYNLALCLHALGRHADALAQIENHLLRHPDDGEARVEALEWRAIDADANASDWAILQAQTRGTWPDPRRLARTAARHGRESLALEALAQVADDARTAAALIVSDALRERGDVDAAKRSAELGHVASDYGRRSPGLRALLVASLTLPPLMRSREAIAADRSAFASALRQLDERWTPSYLARCEPALEQLVWSNFHLAYHGENDRELQHGYARLIERATACFAPSLARAPAAGNGGRIGLLSSCWRDCTAGAYFGGWIGWLRDAGYDVRLYQLGPRRDAATERLAARSSEFVFHEGGLQELAERVRADRLDLLLYPEIGMDARLLPLAALRLARRQAAAWGHPVTTGLSTIDAFISCAAMEPPDAGTHYVEPLLTLPALGIEYARPAAPPEASRSALGLPSKVPLVLVPQSLFKLHPDNDAVLAELCARVPEARVVLFEGEHPLWQPHWLARARAAFAAHGLDIDTHLHWMPLGSRQRFLQINRVCDLMLDSVRWSGGNTSLDAIESGLPVLTVPGDTMRSRQSQAMIARMGLGADLVCAEPGELAANAARLLGDPERLARIASDIEARRTLLFDGHTARAAFLERIGELCALA